MSLSNTTTALVVEPDAADRRRLRSYLVADGYEALLAPTARLGLELARQRPPDVVLLEVELPGREAAALARRIRALPSTRQATIIALADPGSLDDVVGVMQAGVDDFVAKPFGRPELRSRIESATRSRAQTLSADAPEAIVAALGNAIDASDGATGSHSQRVGRLAANLGASVAMSPEDLEAVVLGALLHDVGKIGIPDAVLNKAGALSGDEWEMLQRHPEMGEAICRPLAMSRHLGPIIRHHHERWDGSGYPDGLAGRRIPLGARVVAVVDAFDAMLHERSYRSAGSVREAIDEIRRGAGSQFDPELARLFVAQFATGDGPARRGDRSIS